GFPRGGLHHRLALLAGAQPRDRLGAGALGERRVLRRDRQQGRARFLPAGAPALPRGAARLLQPDRGVTMAISDREPGRRSTLRPDLVALTEWIAPGERVLDLGCGDGVLLRHLIDTKGVVGYGIENDPARIVACIE